MTEQKLTLAVRPRGILQKPAPLGTSSILKFRPGKPVKKLPDEVSVSNGGTATELYKALAAQVGTTEHRLRVTKGSDGALVPNSKDVQLESTGLREQSTIYVKDLGR